MALDGDVVTIAGIHTKNRLTHRFPVGALAQGILAGNPDLSWSGWSKYKGMLDAKISSLLAKNEPVKVASVQPWTLHDLRRTYATNLQRLGIKLEVIEALLNHISGTRAGIVGIYQRHQWWDEMVEAVAKHDRWLTALVGGKDEERRVIDAHQGSSVGSFLPANPWHRAMPPAKEQRAMEYQLPELMLYKEVLAYARMSRANGDRLRERGQFVEELRLSDKPRGKLLFERTKVIEWVRSRLMKKAGRQRSLP